MAILPAHDQAAVGAAVAALADGLVIAIPTDTVYGLAVDPFVPGATDRLFEAKRRPRDVDLPVLVHDLDQALALATAVPHGALVLMERFWPGALTLVVPRRPDLVADLDDDEATVGLRSPDHPLPRRLCEKVGPLATTSANRHGRPTLETAEEVAAQFGEDVAVVLDGGACRGSASTVVDCTGVPAHLRTPRATVSGTALARPLVRGGLLQDVDGPGDDEGHRGQGDA